MPGTSAPTVARKPSVTLEQAQRIVSKHLSDHMYSTIMKITEIAEKSFSYTPNSRSYLIDLGEASSDSSSATSHACSCWLTIATSTPSSGTSSLPIMHQLLSKILAQTDIPILPFTLDTSLADIPYHYLLSSTSQITSAQLIPLSKARQDGLLTPKDTVLIDLQLGQLLGRLHSGVQNDWFGLPSLTEPADPSYSWQETFTALLEALLVHFESSGLQLPYEDLRRCLSRAIGFFLFDDVDVPSLIWFTGSEDDIFVAIPSLSPPLKLPNAIIAGILPSLVHATWGDPLLESFFLPPGPSEALLEGYKGGGGAPLIVFPRQKTKRLWYTLFLALVVLKEHGLTPKEDDEHPSSAERREWCKETATKCVEALKNAPCY